MNFVWMLLTPFSFIFNLVQRIVGYNPSKESNQDSDDDVPNAPKSSTGSYTTQNRPKT